MELKRCVNELGAVGCILNPDVYGGSFDAPPIYDEAWHPLYQAMVDLQVPAMWHVTKSPKRQLHFTTAYYLMAGVMVQTQLSEGGDDLFNTFPTLKLIFPHGGSVGPYQGSRNRGIALHNKEGLTKGCNPKMRPFVQFMESGNAFVDTVLMGQDAIDLLLKRYPKNGLLFGSEMDGAARGIDPETGRRFDDTLPLIVSAVERQIITSQQADEICWGNFAKAYLRLAA